MSTISLTDLAKSKLDEYLAEEPAETVVRILVEDDGKYGLSLDTSTDSDASVDGGQGLKVVVESSYAEAIDGVRVDYLDQGASSGFSLTGGNPNAAAGPPTVKRVESTPNPDARKFVLSVTLGKRPRTWTKDDAEAFTPAIAKLFELGVASVFQLDRFVTVTREGDSDWDVLEPKVKAILSELEPDVQAEAAKAAGTGGIVDQLQQFISSDVAPFLKEDGGDFVFVGFVAGVVKVKLHGACGTCPSAVATLHMGVERRLKTAFEEVKGLERVG